MIPRLIPSLLLALSVAHAEPDLKIGLIGLDTSHCERFAQEFNDPAAKDHIAGARIVCAFKGGSPDVKLSASRVDRYTAELRDKYGVSIVDTIAEVVARSDAVMILSLDGRVHLAQAREVFGARKPVFIDKPLAGSLHDAVAIARLAREDHTPVYSSSALRFTPWVLELRDAKIGRLRGAIAYGPAPIEPHVPDLFYYGIHPATILLTLMGPDCESVSCIHTADSDVVSGLWPEGRTGVLFALRNGKNAYGATVFGTTAVVSRTQGHNYEGMVKTILTFFRTGKAPISIDETLKIIAYLQAADESKKLGGAPVSVRELLAKENG